MSLGNFRNNWAFLCRHLDLLLLALKVFSRYSLRRYRINLLRLFVQVEDREVQHRGGSAVRGMADTLPFELILELLQSHRLVLLFPLFMLLLSCHISVPLHDETFALVSIVVIIRGSSSDHPPLLTSILAGTALERRLRARWGDPSHHLRRRLIVVFFTL